MRCALTLLVLATCLLVAAFAQNELSGVFITTVAGDGTGAFRDASNAAEARFQQPYDVALDEAGRKLYIADRANHRIRLLNLRTSGVSTVAGSGTEGFSDATAALAQFDQPECVRVLSSTVLLVCDTQNSRIRKINLATNMVTTVAGNGNSNFVSSMNNQPATSAAIGRLRQLTVDANGDYYFCERGEAFLWKVTDATGIITVIAGQLHDFIRLQPPKQPSKQTNVLKYIELRRFACQFPHVLI